MSSQPKSFLPTRWSLIAHCANASNPCAARIALEELCRLYWFPVYATIRRLGTAEEDARDLTQEFFAYAAEHGTLGKADSSKGLFRTFIHACLGNFLHNAHDKANALKRGGAREIISIEMLEAEDRYVAEGKHDLTPDRLFDRVLALEIIRLAEQELQKEYEADGRHAFFLACKPHLYEADPNSPYADLARSLAMSVGTLKSGISRIRGRFREILRIRVEDLVTHPEDARQELIALQQAL